MKRSYGFTHKHLKMIAKFFGVGFHVAGMKANAEHIYLDAGGTMTIVVGWE